MIGTMRRYSDRAFGARARRFVAFILLGIAAASPRALAGTIRDDRDPQLYLNLGADLE